VATMFASISSEPLETGATSLRFGPEDQAAEVALPDWMVAAR